MEVQAEFGTLVEEEDGTHNLEITDNYGKTSVALRNVNPLAYKHTNTVTVDLPDGNGKPTGRSYEVPLYRRKR